MEITARHDPFDIECRSPFGALPCGGGLRLRVFVRGACGSVSLRVWDGTERILKPDSKEERGGETAYSFGLTAPDAPCVLWYSFHIETPGGRLYVGAADKRLRCGCVCGKELPIDYRVTVYDGGFRTPDWFKGCIAYQIFPDRFSRGEYPGLQRAIQYHRSMSRSVYEKEWNEPVDYLPREGKRYYSPSDFYFGNFRGIADRIPYLKSLSVEAVYLNPICESPYNHRYSISNYMSPDPLLGTEADFAYMCSELKRNGIRLILDGVFSHTGDDSAYFDRYSRYGGGAYSDHDSPYRSWYVFDPKYKCGYRSWWGFDTLPEVDELEPSYMEFIGRVVEKWMRLGASGWRLDVADELPNGFIKYLRKRIKAVDPDALLIGEVWEDAAVKEGDCDGRGAHGRRGYTDGDMLDGVMDYPFADAVCDFLSGKTDSANILSELTSQLAGYPDEFMRAQLGMLGSHDTYRVLSRLSGAPDKDTIPRAAQAVWKPAAENAAAGRRRLMQASALQFSMPFAPCVFYGDEAGVGGLTDPFCRKPYPWGGEDMGLLANYRVLAGVRSRETALRSGKTAFAAPDSDVFAILRSIKNSDGTEVFITAVSRSAKRTRLAPGGLYGNCIPPLDGLVIEEAYSLSEGVKTDIFCRAEGGGVVFDIPAEGASFIKARLK